MAWCHVPGTDCPSAQAAEALIWASCLQNPVSTPAPSSNGVNTHGGPSLQANGPDTWPQPRSGMISPLLTPDHCAARSTPFLPDIPASRSAKPDSGAGLMMSGTFGPMLPGSSGNVTPNGSSLKTSPGTSASALRPYCENYGAWATRLRLAHSQRLKQARRTNGSDGSAWPTATALSQAQTNAQTPGQTGGTTLAGAAELLWTTPQAHDVRMRGAGQTSGATGTNAGNRCLATDATNWATPSARDMKGSSPVAVMRKNGKSRMDLLDFQTEQGFSHPGPMPPPNGRSPFPPRQTWRLLRQWLISSHGRAVSRRLQAQRWQATAEPDLCRMADGLATRSFALRLLGNGVVPLVAGHAWRTLAAAHGLRPLDLATANGSRQADADVSWISAAGPTPA